ncbi:alpha/beta hydrolase [uncultured Methylibium sp.]|uniref:alpha/beta fold hydrolase n=1 Tax=uncultured Methylibium sp. TaxID=381093 RepID=UPI0025EB6A13|nr:alpha/beta hydrolase [uncultured Methylibium sp.]
MAGAGGSARLHDWRRGGACFLWRGHRIFVAEAGSGPPLLLIHGYPTGSYDWFAVWDALAARHRLLAPDLLGLGWSDKPAGHRYGIADHADMIEALLTHHGIARVHVLAHDLGVSIAQELLARQREGPGRCRVESLVMLNGGLCPEAYRPRPIQRLLASPLGRWIGPRVPRRAFERAIRSLFGPGHAPAPGLIDDFWQLLEHHDGRRVAHAVGRFWVDRLAQRDRLVATLREAGPPRRLINGAADPNSGRHMAERYRELLPDADIVSLAAVGHWPQIEAPARVVEAVLQITAHLPDGAMERSRTGS